VADVSGEPAWVGRLAELGVAIGCRLQVLRPGSPCLLQVGESRVSLRSGNATQILVRPVAIAG
jgi:Fe2+ transport system protein FeoA